MFEIAVAAACGLPIVTKAKPRERPVSRSVTTWTSVTSPFWVKAARTLSAVALKDRLPT
jgi:hypothetical protein